MCLLQFNKSLAIFLHQNYTRKSAVAAVNIDLDSSTTKCAYCELPISMPVIGISLKLDCNHLCHKICSRSHNICIMCNKNV